MISVIIVNWNGAHLLPDCLDSLRRQSFREFEVVMVDNASTDGSLDLLTREYPEARLIALSQNLGLSGGTNIGIRATRRPIVITLNNDTEAHPEWLAELVSALERHPEAGSVATKMLLFDRRTILHSAGDFFSRDGTPGNRGVWQQDSGQFDMEELVFGACAGAAAYRRAMLDDIGLFDESFFMYCEDVDLAFRAQIAGYRCVYAPRAVVYHMLSATGGGSLASYYCGRNFLRVIAKNLPSPLLRRYWPRIARAQLRIAMEALAHVREPAARARLRGQLAGLWDVPRMIPGRRQIQRGRRVPVHYLDTIMAAA